MPSEIIRKKNIGKGTPENCRNRQYLGRLNCAVAVKSQANISTGIKVLKDYEFIVIWS